MTIVAGTALNPFLITETTANPSYKSLVGKVVSTPLLLPGDRTFTGLIAGQSNGANYATGANYTPTNADKIDNLNFIDGGTYKGADPALGASGSGSSWLFRFADKLISGGLYDRVILVPIAVGATSVLDWLPSGIVGKHFAAASARCANVGLVPSAILWQQGEADHAMTQATYKTNLLSVIGSSRAAGFVAPWLVGKSTYNGGVTSAPVRAACAEVVNGLDVFAGADTDTLTGTANRDAGLTHFNAAGADAAATLWKAAVDAAF